MLRSILSSPYRRSLSPFTLRRICTTPHRESWMDKVKGVFTGKKSEVPDMAKEATLLRFADEIKKRRKLASLKQLVGGNSKANLSLELAKQEEILRYLGGFDATGENLQSSHIQEAAKQCNCNVEDVENALSKFKWLREAQLKCEQLHKEGKPMPKSITQIQKLMGSTPMPSKLTSRNSPCPCGSKKLYKRCCGKDTNST